MCPGKSETERTDDAQGLLASVRPGHTPTTMQKPCQRSETATYGRGHNRRDNEGLTEDAAHATIWEGIRADYRQPARDHNRHTDRYPKGTDRDTQRAQTHKAVETTGTTDKLHTQVSGYAQPTNYAAPPAIYPPRDRSHQGNTVARMREELETERLEGPGTTSEQGNKQPQPTAPQPRRGQNGRTRAPRPRSRWLGDRDVGGGLYVDSCLRTPP